MNDAVEYLVGICNRLNGAGRIYDLNSVLNAISKFKPVMGEFIKSYAGMDVVQLKGVKSVNQSHQVVSMRVDESTGQVFAKIALDDSLNGKTVNRLINSDVGGFRLRSVAELEKTGEFIMLFITSIITVDYVLNPVPLVKE